MHQCIHSISVMSQVNTHPPVHHLPPNPPLTLSVACTHYFPFYADNRAVAIHDDVMDKRRWKLPAVEWCLAQATFDLSRAGGGGQRVLRRLVGGLEGRGGWRVAVCIHGGRTHNVPC